MVQTVYDKRSLSGKMRVEVNAMTRPMMVRENITPYVTKGK